jgi:rubrerythrin
MLLNFELILSLLVPAAVAMKESDKTTTGTTLDHLQEAFNGETNAHYRYLAFAAQADIEGFHQVASLFRATARAEEIHARNHSDVIRMIGAQPKSKIEKPVVKSTRENLRIAMDGEIYERDKMYPPMIEEAKASKHPEAVRTFIYCLCSQGGSRTREIVRGSSPVCRQNEGDHYLLRMQRLRVYGGFHEFPALRCLRPFEDGLSSGRLNTP